MNVAGIARDYDNPEIIHICMMNEKSEIILTAITTYEGYLYLLNNLPDISWMSENEEFTKEDFNTALSKRKYGYKNNKLLKNKMDIIKTDKGNKEITPFIMDVLKFHNQFNQPILETPQIPELKRANFRVELLEEEVKEFKKAIEENNLVEVADALGDTMYVLCGAIIEFGLGDKFVEIFEEIQRSNMTKACKSILEVTETIQSYKDKGIDTYEDFDSTTGLFSIYRESDDKVMKSINYSPANLKPILDK